MPNNTSLPSPCLPSMRRQSGFTLIEGIVAMVLLSIAMVTLSSFLFPQAEQSARPYYQARAAAIANAFYNTILSRQFDENSGLPTDNTVRCDETAFGAAECTDEAKFGPDSGETYRDGESASSRLNVAAANDVDDFEGCWGDRALCATRYSQQPWRGPIESLLHSDGESTDSYLNMTVDVAVGYDASMNTPSPDYPHQHKRITLQVDTGRHGTYDFSAFRSNY